MSLKSRCGRQINEMEIVKSSTITDGLSPGSGGNLREIIRLKLN